LSQFDDDLLEVAGELERHLVQIVLDDGCAGVLAHVQRLIERKAGGDGAFNHALRHLLAIHRECADCGWFENA
jgi:hypothetical protein